MILLKAVCIDTDQTDWNAMSTQLAVEPLRAPLNAHGDADMPVLTNVRTI